MIDFRTQAFGIVQIGNSGRFLGRRYYWKLYSIENILRALVFTILTVELGPSWWTTVVDEKIQGKINFVKSDYVANPVHNVPGNHDIYFLFLPDLTKIIFENVEQFRPTIPGVDTLVVSLERIRLPRNLVGHMNWPNQDDRNIIEETYRELKKLVFSFNKRGLAVSIP